MDTPERAIVEEIKDAFPRRRPYCFAPIVNSEMGEEPHRVAAAFFDKDDWHVLEAEWVDQVPNGLGSALSFLSDEAICFYIPAYLVADLEGRLHKADPVFALCRGFDLWSYGQEVRIKGERPHKTWTDYATQRWMHLNAAQALAIVH
ncbi:MAG TPA: hypothetical protein VL492_03035 [Methylovirgula sp.]|nr:hypothetical protein [Methylovirgula sp.]